MEEEEEEEGPVVCAHKITVRVVASAFAG